METNQDLFLGNKKVFSIKKISNGFLRQIIKKFEKAFRQEQINLYNLAKIELDRRNHQLIINT